METETQEQKEPKKKEPNKESILGNMFENIANADILGGKSMFDEDEEEEAE